jgi:gas vesicle protein GvpL/GvpF
MKGPGTYVYCAVSSPRRPTLPRRYTRLPGIGPVRLLDAGRGLWIVVADAAPGRFGEEAINRRLGDLDWVSKVAVAHESIVESLLTNRAVLPMKLFTIFASDERAVESVQGDRGRIDRLVRLVSNQHEWGVRVTLAGRRSAPVTKRTQNRGPVSGADYLTRKKANRDAALARGEHAREALGDLYDRLEMNATRSRRRAERDLPLPDGPLLLDAAFLVPRSRSKAFRTLAAREARRLERDGYHLVLSGPWPPYTFVKD